MGKNWFRITRLLPAVVLAVCMLPKNAVGAVNLGNNTVDVVFTGNAEDAKDFEGVTASVDFYKLADAVEDPVFDTYGYAFKKGFEGVANEEEMKDPNAEVWSKIGDRASTLIFGENPVEITPVTKEFPLSDGDKCELESGLYLVIPHDDNGLPVMGEDGKVTSYVDTPVFRYIYSPVIVTMPSTHERTDEPAMTSGGIGWTNDITVVLKPEKEYRLGQLRIVKSLTSFESRTAATFVFSVDAWLPQDVDENGNPTKYCYNNAVSITFNPGSLEDQEVSLDGIPGSAIVEVKEIYSGASYKLINTEWSADDHVISAEDILTVTFTNEHTHEDRTGYGINNHFDKVDDNWQWLNPNEQGGEGE